MATEKAIDVTPRPQGGDLLMWTEYVMMGTIAVDHHAEHPTCYATHMEYAKIPVEEGAEGVGMAPRLDS